jgi:hypothetical protein
MTISANHTFSEKEKGMVSLGLCFEGSGKPAILSATAIVCHQRQNIAAGKRPTTHTRSV